MSKILVIGAKGQIGSELVPALRERYGWENVVSSDIKPSAEKNYMILDATKKDAIEAIVAEHEIDTIYNLASLISAAGEENPLLARDLNLGSLFNVLDLAREYQIKVFWPSSIAAFGKTTPKTVAQHTITEPIETFYGATKVAGELFCANYHRKFGVDVRSLRYPGIISYAQLPQGGTTDYASWMIHAAVTNGTFDCFLKEDTLLPLMYMDDCVRATIELMEQDRANLKIRTSYNLSGFSCTPKKLEQEIRKHFPEFQVTYTPDHHQAIADNWPGYILDDEARQDWGWTPAFDLKKMTKAMIAGLRKKNGIKILQ
ncbi:MAG: NAD-dependent epimerase/dehydratase family protein [Nanoarchaeota archaeon]